MSEFYGWVFSVDDDGNCAVMVSPQNTPEEFSQLEQLGYSLDEVAHELCSGLSMGVYKISFRFDAYGPDMEGDYDAYLTPITQETLWALGE